MEEYAEEALVQLVLDSSLPNGDSAYYGLQGEANSSSDDDDDAVRTREIEELGQAMAASLKEKEDAAMLATPLTEKSPEEIISQFSESKVSRITVMY